MKNQYMLHAVLGFGLFANVPGAGQQIANQQVVDLDGVPPEKDFGDLYHRAAGSRFVVTGTVVEKTIINRKLLPSETPSMDADIAGTLYTIQVEHTVCRQMDFSRTLVAPGDASSAVHVFVPRDEPRYVGGHRQEVLALDERYLLFLVAPEEQERWVKSYQLDPKIVYYRTEERSRGVVRLAKPNPENPHPKQPDLLDKVTRLCEAVRPSNLADKLAALNELAGSGDPILQKEAQNAMDALQAPPR